jgi:outer membrane receptor protein involved in Fe transport
MALRFSATALLVAVSTQLFGQITTGSILGTTYDSTGAAIPNCQITATNLSTHATRAVNSNEAGYYIIPSLPPGSYQLTAKASGFAETSTQLTVMLGKASNFDFHLQTGTVTQNIEVSALSSNVELNTSSHQVDAQLATQSLENMPANGRDIFQVLQSLPSVSPFQNTPGPVSNFKTTTNSLSIGGSATGMTSYLQDGITNIAMLTKTANFQPPIEATQEVSILENGASAQYDEPSVVNVITKTGSGAFHGRVYDYLQNDLFNAIGYFKRPKPPLRYNQFGANIGGPVVKNKLFFFFDYAGLRSSTGTTLYADVPTAAERQGDFSQDSFTIYDPAHYDPQTGAISAFSSNMIPSGRISQFATLFMQYFPLPTGSSVAGQNFQKNVTNTSTYNSFLGKVDYNLGRNDTLYGAFETTNPAIFNPRFSTSSDFNYLNNQTAKNAYLQETHIFSTNLVNVAKMGYNESNIFYRDVGSKDYVSLFGLANLNPLPSQYQPPAVTFTAHTGLGDPGSPQGALQRLFEFSDDVDITHGKHSIYAGIVLDKLDFNGSWGIWNNGQYTFNGQFTSDHATHPSGGSDLADMLLGFPSTAEGGTGVTSANFQQWNVLPYLQDDWKVTRNLTLNLGLRYDLYGAPADANGHSNVYDVPTNSNHPGTFHQQYLTLAPRFGFAYALSHGMALHGGYGIYYSPFQYNQLQFMMINEPNFFLQLNTYSIANPTPVTDTFLATPSLSAEAPFTIQLQMKTPYVQQWNLAMQKSIGAQWIATVTYLGNKSTHLEIRRNPNQAAPPADPINPGSIQSRRPYPWVGDVYQIASVAYGNYNGLMGELKRSFANGITFSTNYVWSKALDALSNGAEQPEYGPNVQAEYGLSDFNAAQVFKASGIYQLPFGSGGKFLNHKNWFGTQAIGGWQAGGILTIQSGLPFNASANDLSQTGAYHAQRANRLCNGNDPQGQSFNHWFNTSCYVQPGVGELGNEGRDDLIGPRTTNLDMSFSKAFAIHDQTALQFRADLFDSLNHPLPGVPVSAVTSPSYGEITNIPGARIVQFSLKFVY